ncbi:zinc finger BED domain-containing protein 5-like [Palaemon carinicauda]|uniref:zinc finger BED domain-containing protein 5-like n=1 Tax=Palaemon carinicauda TaxID=392227 RepID=UPI0035B5FD54
MSSVTLMITSEIKVERSSVTLMITSEIKVERSSVTLMITNKVDIEKVSVNLSLKEADNLVEIATSGTLKTLFRERSLANFWAQVQPEYPGLAEIALKHLMPFPTTYNCEIGFSTLVDLKTKKRNRINVEPDMRLKLSRLEPDIPTVILRLEIRATSGISFPRIQIWTIKRGREEEEEEEEEEEDDNPVNSNTSF